MKIKVSVIIPCYNAERWIGEAIQSCLDQTYQPTEIIVVDDGSKDQSRQAVLRFACNGKVAVRLIETGNNGAAAARNHGLAQAVGDYIQFMDADLMSHRKLGLQISAVNQNPGLVPCGPWLWLKQSNGIETTELSAKHLIRLDDPIHE